MPKVEKYIARKRVRGTDFITGTDKDGNVVRFSGAFFIREIVNESNYLSLILDEQEARIAADELLDDKIATLGGQMGLNLGNLQIDLDTFKVNVQNDIFGPGGLQESLSSSITQTDSEIRLEVERLLYGEGGITESYNSAITQTAQSISSSVDMKLYGEGGIEESYSSLIQQTAQSISLSVDEKLYGPGGVEESYSSLIQQTAQSIVLSVESELYGPDGIQQKYTSAIQQYADQIILTVDGTLNDFENEVYTEVGSIIQQSATDILLQVDGKIVDVKGEITTEYTSAITVAKDEIALTVSGQISTLEGDITEAYQSAITVAKGEIALTVDGQLTDLEDGITQAYQSAITVAKDEIGLSVSGQLTTLEGDITEAYESAISVAKDEIALTVNGQLTDLEDGITQAYESAIVVAKGEINMSVAGQLTTLEGDITAAYESAIDISEGQILSTVGTQITGLDGRIASNTSSITQLSDSIDLSVFTNGVLDAGILIGKINDNTSGVRITGKSILLDGDVEITGTAFAENIYASGATLGGFNINETSLQLGTQAAWNPSSGTEGLLMGIDPLDSKYKFYLGDVENHLIWNGENLIISGFALIGDGSSTTTLNDLGKLEGYFEIVNEGQANEYLKLLAPLAVTGEVQAWAADPNIFPPNIWSSLPLASDTTLGAVRIGAGLTYDAVTGMIAVDGDVGASFDESANYSPSGTWTFSGSVSVGGSPVATQAYAQPVITGGASTITSSNLTASRALISNASGKVAVSAVTSTELGYLDGVTGAIQAQLNGKAALAGSSTQDFNVKDLIIHGQVNHWLAQQLVVDDARIQVNRRQDGATVDSGLVIYNKDTSSEVSRLVYDVNGVWKAGGDRLFTEAYNPKLGGYSAASYPRKAEAAVVTGAWTFNNDLRLGAGTTRNLYTGSMRIRDTGTGAWIISPESGAPARWYFRPDGDSSADTNTFFISQGGVGFGTVSPQERLHVKGNGLFEGSAFFKNSYIKFGIETAGYDLVVTSDYNSDFKYLTIDGNNYWSAFQTSLSVGKNTIPSATLDVNGTLLVSGTSTLTGAVTAKSYIGSEAWVSGFTGSGTWRLEGGSETHLTVDRLTVRGRMDVYEMVINQIRATNGSLWVSDGEKVDTASKHANPDEYRIFPDVDNGKKPLKFRLNDIIRAQKWDGRNIVFITARVAYLHSNGYNIKTDGYGGWRGDPSELVGLEFVRIGNRSSSSGRQGALYLTSSDDGSPYLDILDGVDSASFTTPRNIRYIRDWLNGSTSNTGNHWVEIQALNNAGTNIALNKVVTCSVSTASGLTKVVDGITTSTSSDYASGGNGEVSVTVDLGSVQEIDKIKVWHYYADGRTYNNTRTEVSADGVTWYSIFDSILEGTYPETSSGRTYQLGANKTKVRLGRLNGINNLTGYGLYGENTFLTGKLLVGDLTKQGQYMEYENGQLTLKGSITVTGGNAATKADVDAGITAAETSAKNYTDALGNSLGDAAFVDKVEAAMLGTTVIDGGYIKTSLLDVENIVAQGITTDTIEGLTLDFYKGKIGAWSLAPHLFYSGSWDSSFGAGSGIKLDAISNSIMAQHSIPYNSVEMFYRSPTDWGLLGKKNNADVFKLGHVNEIAGITFDDSRLYTQNWWLNKDGSFYFGAGGTIDGGLIVGEIQSNNWDGTKGSKFNLADGSLEFGNVIRLDAFSKEILVRDTDTQQNGVRMGNFLLSPTTGGAGSLDVDVSGSRTVAGGAGYALGAGITYISSSGVITASTVNIASNLTVGNSYAFTTELKATISIGTLRETETAGIGGSPTIHILPSNAKITVRLYSGPTIVASKSITIPVMLDTVAPRAINLNIGSLEFTALSSNLRVEISAEGDVKWLVNDANGEIRYYNANYTISENTTSSRVRIIPSSSITEISAKGFQSLWGESKYFRIYDRAGVTNFIEARGTQEYISPNGNVRLRITDTGIYKKESAGGSWIKL